MMPFHVRVLRRVLLLGSVGTLTGVHRDGASLPIGWRLSQPVPISLTSVILVLSLMNVAMLQHVQEALVNLAIGIGVFFGLLILLWFLWRRRNLHLLLRQVASLERSGSHLYRPGDTTPLYRQMALQLSSFTAIVAVAVVSEFFKEFHYPYLAFPMWVPEPLRFGGGFALVFVLQTIFSQIYVAELLMFTLLVTGLVDAATLQLRLIRRAVLSVCHPDDTAEADNTTSDRSGQISFTTATAEVRHDTSTVTQNTARDERVVAWSGGEAVSDVDLSSPDDGDDSAVVLELQRQSERYRLVHQLASDTANAFSAPLLWLYAAVAISLLLAGYVAAVQPTGQDEVSTNTESLYMTMAYWFVCLSTVTDAGSRLIQQSEELRDVVAKECWSATMSAAARGKLQVLLEQTRTPLALDVCGMFSVEKSVLLSVLSFVLTYFVIMMQMIR